MPAKFNPDLPYGEVCGADANGIAWYQNGHHFNSAHQEVSFPDGAPVTDGDPAEPAPNSVEALKAENDRLKQELAALKNGHAPEKAALPAANGVINLDKWLTGETKVMFHLVKKAIFDQYGVTIQNKKDAENAIKAAAAGAGR